MNKKKLHSEVFELLSTFSKQEMKKFGEFLISPFHNKSKKLVRIYSYIRKFHPEFCDDKLTLESIHNFTSQNTRFHAPTVRNDLSDLYDLSIEYLHVTEYIKNEQTSIHYILYELNSRTKLNLFDKYLKKTESLLNGYKGWNIDLLLENARANSHITNKLLSISEIIGDKDTSTDLSLKHYNTTYEFLIAYSNSIIIEIYINLKLFSIDSNKKISDLGIIKYLESDLFYSYKNFHLNNLENPILVLYLKAFDCYSDFNNIEKFYIYKETYFHLFLKFEKVVQSTHLEILLAYCLRSREITKIRDEFSKEMLELYSFMLKGELYKSADTKFINDLLFRNMIVIALEVDNYKFIENLLKKYIPYLEINEQRKMSDYGAMYLKFREGNYSDSLKLCNRILINPGYLRYDAMNIKLKILYENDNLDTALDMIRSYFKTLEKSQALAEYAKSKHRLLLKLIKKLIFIKLDKIKLNEKTIEYYKVELPRISSYGQTWINKKLEVLKKEKGIK